MIHWFTDHAWLGVVLAGVYLGASLGGILAVRWLVYAPPEFFARNFDPNRPANFKKRHPILRWTLFVVRNALGLLLLVAGITMLVTPGPGILAIFVGLLMLDFPGKHALIVRFAHSRGVLRTLNKLRARAGQPLVEWPASRSVPPGNLVA